MFKESQFTPLPEAETNRIHLDFNLPDFIDSNNIGLNPEAIERLLQLGGFNELTITARVTNTSSTEVLPMGFGTNSQGGREALAGKAKTNTVPVGTSEIRENTGGWPDLEVDINMAEITHRIGEAEQKLTQVGLWAEYINHALSHALVSGGQKHVLDFRHDIPNTILVYTGMILYKTSTMYESGDSNAFPGWLFLTILSLAIASNYYYRARHGDGFESKGKGKRITIFPRGPQFDRAFMLYLIGKTSILVKALETES